MKQKLLTDIELDVQELKCLMESFSKESNSTLAVLLKRSIERMQGRLDELTMEVDAVSQSQSVTVVSDEVSEPMDIEENEQSIENKSLMGEKETAVPKVLVAEEVCIEKESNIEKEPFVEVSSVAEPITKEEMGKSKVLGDNLKLFAGNLRKSISLNDSFRFSRELFGGDMSLMNRVVEQMAMMSSYQSAVAFLSTKIEIDEEKEAVVDFLELLKKYFNQSA